MILSYFILELNFLILGFYRGFLFSTDSSDGDRNIHTIWTSCLTFFFNIIENKFIYICIFIWNFLIYIYIYIYIVQFTVGDVPMGEAVADEQQMDREPHEVLHDIFFYILFFTWSSIYSHWILKHQILIFVCALRTGSPCFAG